jgi:hypothetical protein
MAVPERLGSYSFRSAEAPDASRVAELVDAAYGHYAELIGMLSGPMTDDCAEVIRTRQVTVAEHHRAIVGVIVLAVTDEGSWSTTSRFIPGILGPGWDEPCLSSPRPRRGAPGSIPSISTPHEQMTENLAFYARIGYVEYVRRSQGAFSLVYLRKHLG